MVQVQAPDSPPTAVAIYVRERTIRHLGEGPLAASRNSLRTRCELWSAQTLSTAQRLWALRSPFQAPSQRISAPEKSRAGHRRAAAGCGDEAARTTRGEVGEAPKSWDPLFGAKRKEKPKIRFTSHREARVPLELGLRSRSLEYFWN